MLAFMQLSHGHSVSGGFDVLEMMNLKRKIRECLKGCCSAVREMKNFMGERLAGYRQTRFSENVIFV